MRDWVAEWRQDGDIFVWRYPKRNKHAGEWHLTGDPAGCRSIRNLIDRMAGGEACHRTMRLGRLTPEISAVPNYGEPKPDGFASMRVAVMSASTACGSACHSCAAGSAPSASA